MKRLIRRGKRIERLCLRCNKGFTADGRYNRICPRCKLYAVYHLGGADRAYGLISSHAQRGTID